jgi:type I restriction enzyme M protein
MPLSIQTKNQIDEMWQIFWAGGIANPLTAIEQITYLIYWNKLSLLFPNAFTDHEEFRWNNVTQLEPSRMLTVVRDQVFPFLRSGLKIRESFSEIMKDAVFIVPKESMLTAAVRIINSIELSGEDFDIQGDAYEYLLSELSLAGRNGQFRTPRHIVKTIIDIVDPQPTQSICDPAAGTGGFLIQSFQHIKHSHESFDLSDASASSTYVGYDFDVTMVRLGLMNLMLHGLRDPVFKYQDTLSRSFHPNQQFDLVLANPPFTGSLDKDDINREILTLETSKTELLFLELCLYLLKPGGRCAIILPEGVLFGSTKAHIAIRKRLVDENCVEAIISLPPGTFKPYTAVKTAIMVFRKGGKTKDILFYEVTSDGFTLDDRRIPDPAADDLKYAPTIYRNFITQLDLSSHNLNSPGQSDDKWWFTDRDHVQMMNYNLSAGLYKPHSIDETILADPAEIFEKIKNMNKQIEQRLVTIEKLLIDEEFYGTNVNS